MPELPEVETIVNQLKQKIIGNTVTLVEVKDKIVDSKLKNAAPFQFKDIYRRAKYLVFVLDSGKYILTHLGMTGQFFFITSTEIESKKRFYLPHQVAQFNFKDGSILSHNNMRKFGRMDLLTKEELDKVLSKLGPEPLSAEFTLTKFQHLLQTKPKANLKVTLMDQGFISGIGNIYAQEALYYAGINPYRKAGSLSNSESKLLYEKIRYVLNEGIVHGGASVDNYINLEGEGGHQNYLAVYGRSVCPKKHPLKKVVLGGRGTSYCPICQK
ncbi:MAG: bifunctional DNA-formamidopyrimidine glycosylase/DNA-(apurinic or apyrimidinic site) lyase [Candidatus Woesearchaeota archaeon]